MSLVTRLSSFFLAALALALAGFSVALFLLARFHFEEDFDERLMATLDALITAVEVGPGRVSWRPGVRPPVVDVHPGEDVVRWVVYDGRESPLDHSWNTGHEIFSGRLGPLPDVGHVHRSIVALDGSRWRLAIRRIGPGPVIAPDPEDEVDDRPGPRSSRAAPTLILLAGAPLGPIEASLRTLAMTLAGLSSALWLLAAAAGRSLCRRALDPVTKMATAARAMASAEGRHHLPSPGTGDELEGLARAFNGLLDRLHEALERQKRFTGDASHQLRTPLTALLGQIEVARRRERTAEEYRQLLDQVHGDAVRLRQIVEALLFLARTEAEAEWPDLQAVDLAAWLPRHLARWSAHERSSDLRPDVPDTPAWARVHPPLLGQLLDNLLENACKYSEPGTPIGVRLAREDGAVTLAVEDRGIGLPAEALPHLFEPFYRAPEARRLGKPGFGLGLAVVHRIALAFGGSIRAEGRPGLGSRFVLKLPDASPADDVEAPWPAARSGILRLGPPFAHD